MKFNSELLLTVCDGSRGHEIAKPLAGERSGSASVRVAILETCLKVPQFGVSLLM